MDEQSYINGQQTAYLKILESCQRELNLQTKEQFATERADVILLLRGLCEEYGDNDWPDNLHLSDIIEKHLINYLYLVEE